MCSWLSVGDGRQKGLLVRDEEPLAVCRGICIIAINQGARDMRPFGGPKLRAHGPARRGM